MQWEAAGRGRRPIMNAVFRKTLLVAAVVAVGCSGCDKKTDREDVLDGLVAFAREPSDETWASVPFADHVQLGLGDRLLKAQSARALRDPAAWMLDASLFRGG